MHPSLGPQQDPYPAAATASLSLTAASSLCHGRNSIIARRRTKIPWPLQIPRPRPHQSHSPLLQQNHSATTASSPRNIKSKAAIRPSLRRIVPKKRAIHSPSGQQPDKLRPEPLAASRTASPKIIAGTEAAVDVNVDAATIIAANVKPRHPANIALPNDALLCCSRIVVVVVVVTVVPDGRADSFVAAVAAVAFRDDELAQIM